MRYPERCEVTDRFQRGRGLSGLTDRSRQQQSGCAAHGLMISPRSTKHPQSAHVISISTVFHRRGRGCVAS